MAILGPSGCGKTTLLRLAAGLIEPDRGDIAFNGASVLAVRPEDRGAVMVFQNHALFPFRTVGENVAYGLKVNKSMSKIAKSERPALVARALQAVHLGGFERRWPGDLSGGQQQRVALARSIVVEPKVLLLDEPLSSLDPELRVEVRDTIRDVQRSAQITTLMVTHDRDDALAVADRVAVVLDGTLRQVGEPQQVFAEPVDEETARFLGVAQ